MIELTKKELTELVRCSEQKDVLIFSLGSYVSANTDMEDQTQGNEQMQPPFADELARSKNENEVSIFGKISVINIDQGFLPHEYYNYKYKEWRTYTPNPKLKPYSLECAKVYFLNAWTRDIENFKPMIGDAANSGVHIIIIDNTCRNMLDTTKEIAVAHADKLHINLEIIHRYIGYGGGIALQYHPKTFKSSTSKQVNHRINICMKPAHTDHTYEGNKSSLSQATLRKKWIEKKDEHQHYIRNLAIFYPEGLSEIPPTKLFNPKWNKKNTSNSSLLSNSHFKQKKTESKPQIGQPNLEENEFKK